MSKIEFKSIEEATEAYNKLNDSNISLKNEVESCKNQVQNKDEEILNLKKQVEEITAVANDAIEKFNSKTESNDLIVTISKKKYKIHFGVDGLSKEELSANIDKVKKLIDIGSQAVELIEG